MLNLELGYSSDFPTSGVFLMTSDADSENMTILGTMERTKSGKFDTFWGLVFSYGDWKKGLDEKHYILLYNSMFLVKSIEIQHILWSVWYISTKAFS